MNISSQNHDEFIFISSIKEILQNISEYKYKKKYKYGYINLFRHYMEGRKTLKFS